jgi:hypothetical protein
MIVAAFDLLSQQWIFEVNELFVPNTSTVIWGLVMQGFAVCRLHSKAGLDRRRLPSCNKLDDSWLE